jgi:hypothetical protein
MKTPPKLRGQKLTLVKNLLWNNNAIGLTYGPHNEIIGHRLD